jgi:hypothetical protein
MTTVDAVRHFATGPAPATPLRAAITAACRIPEPEAVAPLLEQARCPPPPPRRCRTWHCNWPSSCAPQGRQRQKRAGAGLAAGVLAVQPGRRGTDVPGRGAAAHSRQRHPRCPDPRQDPRRRLAGHLGKSPRCSSMPPPGACC